MKVLNTTKYTLTREQVADINGTVINEEPYFGLTDFCKESDNITIESIKDYADRCVDACILNQATHAVVGGQSFLMYTLCKELLENGITPLMSVMEKCYKHDSTSRREYFFLHQHYIELKD